ncbi:MAG: response regulator transcription factor [Microscillaceae bacterium]|nr:response regulator transcription factor [Microscillaceae bacterium]
MKNLKVLLVEDDLNLGQILKEYLEVKGYQVKLCRDGEDALQNYRSRLFDFCIFDVMLPKLDGFGLAEKIRENDQLIPIIFLTAKSLKEDTIHGLKIGADDYITKPFRMEELLLRMQAILRRTSHMELLQEESDSFQIGNFEFSAQTQKLSCEGKEQKLTSKESELLRLLCLSKNQMLDRSFALKKVWGDDSYFHARSMDVYITKLRKYLKHDPNLQIINVHGQGFKLIELK